MNKVFQVEYTGHGLEYESIIFSSIKNAQLFLIENGFKGDGLYFSNNKVEKHAYIRERKLK